MPTLVTCKDRRLLEMEWNAASDDFVIPAVGSIVFNLFSIAIVLAVLYPLYFAFSCPSPSPLFYGSFFALLFFDVAGILVEGVILSISAKGSILQNAAARKKITIIINIKILLELIKIVVLIICTYASVSADVVSKAINCPVYKIMLKISFGAVAFLWIRSILLITRGCIYIDPLGMCTRGLLDHLECLDRSMKNTPESERKPQKKPFLRARKYKICRAAKEAKVRKRVDAHQGHVGLRRRLNVICCCVGVGDQISRAAALEDMAKAIHTLFDFSGEDSEIVVRNEDNDIVSLSITDILAGLKLLKQAQKIFKRKNDAHKLREPFIKETQAMMKLTQHRIEEPRVINFSDSIHQHDDMMDNLAYYICYAMGMYGWSFHIFAKPYCGLCELSSVTCCVCGYRCCMSTTARQKVLGEGLCLCHLGALRLRASMRRKKRVIFADYTSGIFRVPYSVTIDEVKETIVVAVRGTLSLKDALTDVSFQLHHIDVIKDDGTGKKELMLDTYVHEGMLKAALMIKCSLENAEVTKCSKVTQYDVLKSAFAEENYRNYKLVITGHSLGAGVASILAIKLQEAYPRLVCYAYSPPGCTFSYSIAKYSQGFITSVVLDNDIVPRISFRSLLHLKYMVIQFLLKTNSPKYKILLSGFCTPCCGEKKEKEEKEMPAMPSMLSIEAIEETEVTKQTTSGKVEFRVQPRDKKTASSAPDPDSVQRPTLNQVSTTEGSMTISLLRASLNHCHPSSIDPELCKKFMPAFPPGRVLHITAPKPTTIRSCFGCHNPSEFVMQEVSNEELCVIEVGKGMVSDHLPNKVFEALQAYKKQMDVKKGLRAGAPPLPLQMVDGAGEEESDTRNYLCVNTNPDNDLWSIGELDELNWRVEECDSRIDADGPVLASREEDGRLQEAVVHPEQPIARQFSEDYCTKRHSAQLASAAEEGML